MNFGKIQKELDYYQKFSPVNFAEERTTFFECLKKNQPYNPLFRYNDRLDVKIFVLLLIVVGALPGASVAQRGQTPPGRVVVCMIQLEHADAEHLASVLRPFLSPDGSLSPYTPTNTLIIKDRQSVVNMLSEIIKGRPCTETSQSPRN